MAEIKISALTTGTPQGTDLTPATDTTDTTQAASGTTKKYVRSSELNFYLKAQGLTTYSAVRVATTGALTVTYANGALGVGATLTNAGAQAALSLDGVALAVNDRVLVKNQATAAQNGIYIVTNIGSNATNWVMTRATDYDQAAEVIQYGVILVNQGTVNAGILYQETGAGPFTIGTTDITFVAFTVQSISLPVTLAQGGTGASLTASNGGIFYSNASTGAILSGTATAGKVLQSGASAAPSWSTPTYPSASGAAGVILRSDGTNNVYSTSTFADTYAVSTILYASGANAVSGLATANSASLVTNSTGVPAWSASMTNGQVIIGSTGATPVAATLSAGSNISITNAAGSITISSNGGSGYVWNEVVGVSQNMAVDNGYIANNAGLVTLALPASSAVGDTVAIVGKGAGGWAVSQAAGQQIQVGSSASTLGAGGSISSTNQWDSIELVCVTANTIWATLGGPQGIITVV